MGRGRGVRGRGSGVGGERVSNSRKVSMCPY